MHSSGTTVFLTTHYLDEADNLCDRLAIVDGGKVVAEGTPEQLKQQISGDVITLILRDPVNAARTLFIGQIASRSVVEGFVITGALALLALFWVTRAFQKATA